ncbi:MAG TPA: type II toxin-antitoxin system RelE/ParE family toxin [Solirubrobacteraceae bacterium]|nr:type II toxin-antitoxin system RelE/ParE family toxin [Solirubrobacteraceae bacterium]
MSESSWDVLVAPPARRQIDRLPMSIAAAVVETLGAIAPNPRRLGKPLRFELEGYLSARRGPYRIIYRIDDATRSVTVVAVAHRAEVYRPR